MACRFPPATEDTGRSRVNGKSDVPAESSRLMESDLYRLASSALALSASASASALSSQSRHPASSLLGRNDVELPPPPPSITPYRPYQNLTFRTTHATNPTLLDCGDRRRHSNSTSPRLPPYPATHAIPPRKRGPSEDRSVETEHPQDHGGGGATASGSDSPRSSRMEKKRKREMLRRSNVNRELESLMSLVLKIDPPEIRDKIKITNNNDTTNGNGKKRRQDETDLSPHSTSCASLSRVELIHLAVTLLSRLHEESEQNKTKTRELEELVKKYKEDSKVTMMFPVMVSSDQVGRHGEPVPRDAIPVPSTTPQHLLYGRRSPILYNAPPFPSSSYYYAPTGGAAVAAASALRAGSTGTADSEPHFVLAPEASQEIAHLGRSNLEALVAAKVAEEVAAQTSAIRRAVDECKKNGNR